MPLTETSECRNHLSTEFCNDDSMIILISGQSFAEGTKNSKKKRMGATSQ